jgi:hypothetical protein
MPKQVRFTQLVKAAGRPHPATLWVSDPAKDPDFKKAIDQNRIVTVHHVNVGTKKESGEIGFNKSAASSYLIFPKALPLAEGTRIIGLKFDMLEEPDVKDPVKIKTAKRKPKIERAKVIKFPTPESKPEPNPEPEPPKPKPPKPQKKQETPTFTVTVEFTAKATKKIEVEAKNASAAIAVAIKQAQKSPPEPKWEVDASTVARRD